MAQLVLLIGIFFVGKNTHTKKKPKNLNGACLSNLLLNNKLPHNLVDWNNNSDYLPVSVGQQSVWGLTRSSVSRILTSCNQGIRRSYHHLKAYLGKDPFPVSFKWHGPDLVPCRLVHWGLEILAGCVLEAALSSVPGGPQAAHNTAGGFIRVSKGGSDFKRTLKSDESQSPVVLFYC